MPLLIFTCYLLFFHLCVVSVYSPFTYFLFCSLPSCLSHLSFGPAPFLAGKRRAFPLGKLLSSGGPAESSLSGEGGTFSPQALCLETDLSHPLQALNKKGCCHSVLHFSIKSKNFLQREEAFPLMVTSKHLNKIVLQIETNQTNKQKSHFIDTAWRASSLCHYEV